jgi:hypothetical protein
MSDKKTKVECRLLTRGTNKVNEKVIDDLKVPDPESTEGMRVLQEEMEKELENGYKRKDS